MVAREGGRRWWVVDCFALERKEVRREERR